MKTVTIKIPETNFDEFIQLVKKFSAKIIKESELEDIAMVNAIKEGEASKTISHEDFLNYLKSQYASRV